MKTIQITDVIADPLKWDHATSPFWTHPEQKWSIIGQLESNRFTIHLIKREAEAPFGGQAAARQFVKYLLLNGFEVYAIIDETKPRHNSYLLKGCTYV